MSIQNKSDDSLSPVFNQAKKNRGDKTVMIHYAFLRGLSFCHLRIFCLFFSSKSSKNDLKNQSSKKRCGYLRGQHPKFCENRRRIFFFIFLNEKWRIFTGQKNLFERYKRRKITRKFHTSALILGNFFNITQSVRMVYYFSIGLPSKKLTLCTQKS